MFCHAAVGLVLSATTFGASVVPAQPRSSPSFLCALNLFLILEMVLYLCLLQKCFQTDSWSNGSWSDLLSWELHVPSSRRKERCWCPSYCIWMKMKWQTFKTWDCQPCFFKLEWAMQTLSWAVVKHYRKDNCYLSNLFLEKNSKSPVKNKSKEISNFWCQRTLRYCFRISDQLLVPVLGISLL